MSRRDLAKIAGTCMLVLALVATSGYAAAGNGPPAAPTPLSSEAPPPEVRDVGASYSYMESLANPDRVPGKGKGADLLNSISPSRTVAPQASPNKLSWTPVRRVTVHPTDSQTLYAAIHNGHGIWHSSDGGKYWDQLPIGSGSGRTVVFANNHTTALAAFGDYNGSFNENGGLFRSTDGGNVWIEVGTTISRTVAAVAFHPTNAGRMYAATQGAGIYRSTNNGGTWTQINNGLSDDTFFSIAVSPSNPNVVYAGGFWWVYRSDNGGDSWYIADNAYPSVYTEAVAVHPSNPDVFYAGAQRIGWLLSTGLTDGGFYKSTAGAGNGNLVLKNSGMQDTFVMDIAQDPQNSGILYAGTWGSGFFRSDDGGVTWQAKNAMFTTPYVYGIEATTGPTGTILYAGTFYTDAGLFKSFDRGESWTEVSAGSNLYPVMFDVTTTGSANKLAATTSRGAYFSNDGGQTWDPASGLRGGEPGVVLEMGRSPTNPKNLLTATYGGGIWTSTSGGQSWTETSTGLSSPYAYDVVFSPSNANIAYAASYGVYRSTNGGGSWSPFGVSTNWVRALDALGGTHPDVFAGTHDQGVYMSPDGSGSWPAINNGLADLRVRSVKAVASNKLFAGTNGSSAWEYTVASRPAPADDAPGLSPTDAGGNDVWTKRGPTITAPGVIGIAIDPSNASIIYAATDQGVYRSTNGGESWTPKNQGLGGYGDLVVSGIDIDRNNPATIYLGTWGYGVFKSTNSGDTWTRLTDPLSMTRIYLPLVADNLRIAPPAGWQTIVAEDFEGTFPGPWEVHDNDTDNGRHYWGQRNCRSYGGSHSAWAVGGGDGAGLSCYSDYPTDVQGWMIFGPFNLTNASAADLTFQLWLNSELNYDGVFRGASIDGVQYHGPTTTGNSQGWIDRTLDLTNVPTLGNLTGRSQVWIALVFKSDSSIAYAEGAYVDNIVLRKYVGTMAQVPQEGAAVDPDTLREQTTVLSLSR